MRLRFDPGTRLLGRAVIGGAPLRVLRLSAPGARVVREWRDGAEIGDTAQQRALADRLVDAGIAHPLHAKARLKRADVTIVVPARDPESIPDADVVVDDGSRTPIPGATVRHPVARGPAAARNAGLARVTTELTAFLDADTEPQAGWLDALLPHFEDPSVVAVAPRIRSTPGKSALARYERKQSSLDLGPTPAPVGPGRRVAYVPTAALVVRTAAAKETGFDERLRFGEDVDFVWRLPGRVRYEPESEVLHAPRTTWRAWAKQRFGYGTSAAPLAKRHGRKTLAPLRVSGWTVLAWGLVAARRPGLGVAVALGTAALLPRELEPLGVPAREALGIALRGHLGAGRYFADALTRTWGPLAVPLLAFRGRTVLALALSRHLRDWSETKPDLDPARWLLARAADDLSYGAGVWYGCWKEHTVAPLVPDFSHQAGKK